MAFYIVTDSASDIPVSIREEYKLHVIPTPVTIDGVDYFDGETILPEDFYNIQKEKHEITTYHINQFMFYEHFEPYAKRKDEVLYICFSTGIAGTFNAAALAKEELLESYPDFQLTIIDSKCASIGFGLVVEKLLRMQRKGAPKELIIEAASFFCEHIEHVVTVDSLEYLVKGGRISKASGFVGGVLDIKPIIIVDEKGALVAAEKVHGWKKAIKRCLELVGQKGSQLDKQTVGVCCGTDFASRDKVIQLLKTEYKVPAILQTQVGCAIGAHTGPGIIGIVFLNELKEEYENYLK